MSEDRNRINKAAADARSTGDGVRDDFQPQVWGEPPLDSPLDRETLDESASNQMGERYESRRRY